MNKTRRTRRGGAGILEMIGLRRPRSPFTGPRVSNDEKKLLGKIKQLEEGIPAVKGLGNFEGFNTTESIKSMEKELAQLKKQLATLRGENTMNVSMNPGYAGNNAVSVGGKRKSRKQRRRRMTRRRR
jgi:hypothetical protein